MVLDTVVDLNVLSYPVLVFRKDQGKVGHGSPRPTGLARGPVFWPGTGTAQPEAPGRAWAATPARPAF